MSKRPASSVSASPAGDNARSAGMLTAHVEHLLQSHGPKVARDLVLQQMPWYTSQSVRGEGYLDSITPAAAMLNMLGVPPAETNRVIVSTLCNEIRAEVGDLTPGNLVSCFKKRIMKWIPHGVLDNQTLQDTVVEVVNCIPVENVTQELTAQFKIMWKEGKHKPYWLSNKPFLSAFFKSIFFS